MTAMRTHGAHPPEDEPSSWRGDLVVGDLWASWRGAAGDAAPHRHLAAQAVIAPMGVRVRVVDGEGQQYGATVILIDPLASHALLPIVEAQILFVEPGAICAPAVAPLLETIRAARDTIAIIGPPEGGFWRAWLDGEARSSPWPPPGSESLADLIDRLAPLGLLRLETAASAFGLSNSRFRHRFSESFGLPFRRYVLWRRLRLAAVAMMQGADATSAAHAAGFADQSHYARTLRSMFGVTAGQALSKPRLASGSRVS